MTWPDGQRYEGGWKNDARSGQGVMTGASGQRYEGEWRYHKRSGQGLLWLPGGNRVFDGTFADGFPLQGTALESDGALYYVALDGQTYITTAFSDKAARTPAGRVVWGGAPPQGEGGGPSPTWTARVELPDGVVLEGEFHGLRPDGLATLVEGGATYAVEYDGARTIAEGPEPVRKEVCRGAPCDARAAIPLSGRARDLRARASAQRTRPRLASKAPTSTPQKLGGDPTRRPWPAAARARPPSRAGLDGAADHHRHGGGGGARGRRPRIRRRSSP
jgi:hypothetical protein